MSNFSDEQQTIDNCIFCSKWETFKVVSVSINMGIGTMSVKVCGFHYDKIKATHVGHWTKEN